MTSAAHRAAIPRGALIAAQLDGTAVRVPDRRPPAPPPITRRDAAAGCLGITWSFIPAVWMFVGLPLLLVAVILTWTTGNWLFVAGWLVISAVAMATLAAIGGFRRG